MKINFNPTQNNFGARPIYPIKLKQLVNNTYKTVDGFFSELSPKDGLDCAIIDKIGRDWNALPHYSNLTQYIPEDFYDTSGKLKHFVVEVKNPQNGLYENLKSIVQITNPQSPDKTELGLSYIQSAPEIIKTFDDPPIKGAGELGVYGIVRLARDNGFKKVSLTSSNNGFYDKLGFNQIKKSYDRYGIYELPCDKYDEFLDRIRKRYDLKS